MKPLHSLLPLLLLFSPLLLLSLSSCEKLSISVLRKGVQKFGQDDLHDPSNPQRDKLVKGYFVQDSLDMICNEKLQKCWELLFHHFVVIVCFGFAFLVRRFVGFAMVALLVEINSVFLHLRKILQMAGLANTASFRLTSLVNLGTYLVFRILILAWMSHWLALNWENVPAVPCAMGMMGMAIMLPINVVLFYRLLCSDLLPSHKK